MADQTRLPPEVERWVGTLTGRARNAWRNGPGPAVLGKIGFRVALPGLDAASARQLAVLRRARRTLADLATSAKRLELRIGELEREADNLAERSQAGEAGKSQAAADVTATLAETRRDYAEVTAREERVRAASQRLAAEIDAFRQAKNAAEAAHTAAEEAAQSVWAEISVPSLDQHAEPQD